MDVLSEGGQALVGHKAEPSENESEHDLVSSLIKGFLGDSFLTFAVSAYAIKSSIGTIALGSAIAAGTRPAGIAADPTGKFVYVANYGR